MKKAETRHVTDSAWEQARTYGMDMSLLAANLRRTPAELLQQHQRALTMALMLREGMKKLHA